MVNIKLAKKIEEGRELFPKLNVKKSGKNKFHHFDYYELGDLLPPHRYLCSKLKIHSQLDRSDEGMAKYIISDLEQDDDQEVEIFYAPSSEVMNSNVTQGQQEKGAVQKYAWRYLLLQVWEIGEGDSIDAGKINLNTKIEVSKERIDEVVEMIGEAVYKNGGDNTNKAQLTKELNKQFKSKKITSQEYREVKQIINNMK